jgi:hypothetical protein
MFSGPALRHARAESWRSRARRTSGDLDAQFIFSWIAFNALYGQARYRETDDRPRSEMRDIEHFLKLMLQLDARSVSAVLREQTLRPHFDCLLGDKFLHDCCWKAWDREEIVDRDRREALVPHCNEKHDHQLIQLFRRLYVLRKQIFHGCSKDGSSKNRPSLRAAAPVIARFVDTFAEIVSRKEGTDQVIRLLGAPPYPPTQDNARWNTPRLTKTR